MSPSNGSGQALSIAEGLFRMTRTPFNLIWHVTRFVGRVEIYGVVGLEFLQEDKSMGKDTSYTDHRKRLRERFHRAGPDGLNDYEMLELLLTYAVPRRDVKPIAKNLIKGFGSVSGVLDADRKRLEEVEGFGSASSCLVRLVKELCGVYLGERIKRDRDILSSPRLVVDFAHMKLAGLPREAFMVIYLNVKNEVIHYETLQEGTVDHVVVYPRRIIESALLHHSAGLILVHNHPSGNPEPSDEDKRLTYDVREAARTLDIKLLDHLVVGKEGYFSFMESNLL